MIVRTIEILLEFISIILCIHRVAGKKIKFNIWLIGLGIFEIILMFLIAFSDWGWYFRIFIYVGIFLYVRKNVVNSWDKAVKAYGIMLVSIISLQIIVYFLFKLLRLNVLNTYYGGIAINAMICLFIRVWNPKYFNLLVNKIKSSRVKVIVILFAMSLFCFLRMYNQGKYMNFDTAILFLIGTIGFSMVSILWISAENENKHKAKELKIYESYSIAFEEAIKTIRIRQHEFENHINAIRCLQYTIKNHEELICEQEKYCDNVLKENSINKLLTLKLEPILVGFLYSKITMANQKGIQTEYDICFFDNGTKIEIYELIELLGILFDNAVEALDREEGNKCIFLMLKSNNENKNVKVEISNTSRIYHNSELEKFCTYGYSTKGNKRGMGLSRAKEIVNNYNGILQIQNYVYNSENYLCFKINL